MEIHQYNFIYIFNSFYNLHTVILVYYRLPRLIAFSQIIRINTNYKIITMFFTATYNIKVTNMKKIIYPTDIAELVMSDFRQIICHCYRPTVFYDFDSFEKKKCYS